MSTPFIVHWPAGIEDKGELRHQVAHLIDLMPTFIEVSGAEYPKEFKDHEIQPMAGMSLVPFFSACQTISRTLFWEHEGNRAIRDGRWKLVGSAGMPWELYHIAQDRTELKNLVMTNPEKYAELKAKWDAWADDVGVIDPEAMKAARKAWNQKQKQIQKEKEQKK